jgi:16S rRNA (adenine1518-N6/adenine1519-N6)-dimethyltransferase
MGIYKPSELLRYLEDSGLRPKKSLSQNFLIDQNILNKLIAKASISGKDLVVEIGPGPGAITEKLLAAGARVIAIELDSKMAAGLRRLHSNDHFRLIEGDILKTDLAKLTKGEPFKVVANLPYNITSPILSHLFDASELLTEAYVFVQKEVADRITAKPKEKAYGSLSVFCTYYADTKLLFKVSAGSFMPRPKVDSAVVKLDLRKEPRSNNPKAFFKLTRQAFNHRRKTLRSSLSSIYSKEAIEAALQKANLGPLARPEELGIDQLLELSYDLENSR